MSNSEIITQARSRSRNLLTEVEAKDLLREAGIPVVETRLAQTKKDALALSRKLGFPTVLKIVSPQIIHKSDVGGVKLGLANATQVGKAYAEIMAAVKEKAPGAEIYGVSVQHMARPGVEIIVGMSKDPQFGPVIMFGIGGILVEVLKDVSFRIVPITRRDAGQMIREIKGYPILEGYRGQEPANIPQLEDLLLKVS
ncbi:MAG: acetate--CoA ligase family protein, partial [Chloroflexota bacterium]|nr:acetate--CoA ligase family protein [Chloroflexota bacterium]